MPSSNEPDPYAILTALGIEHPTSVTSVTGGADTALWRVPHIGQAYALRVFRPEQQARYQREQIAMKLAAAANLPVPRVIAAGICDDYPALFLSWCPGRTLRAQLKLQPWRVWALGSAFGRMQAKLHAIAVPADLVQQAANWIPWKDGANRVFPQEFSKLTTGSASLLHLDYHQKNVIVEGNRVTGIIDWANVHVGDKRVDFARTYTILRVEPWTAKPSLGLTLMRWLLEKAWRHGYQQVAGVLNCGCFENSSFCASKTAVFKQSKV
jgi:aminoglycoside phosphotransferase (APT) family kinase protein